MPVSGRSESLRSPRKCAQRDLDCSWRPDRSNCNCENAKRRKNGTTRLGLGPTARRRKRTRMATVIEKLHPFATARTAGRTPYKVRDLSLADFGRKEIRLAE